MANNQFLNPSAATGGRAKQVQEARDMEKAVRERASRMNVPAPPYELQELIGKGSFGRVFKSRSQKDRSLVAVKIIDVDKMDYDADSLEKDQAIKDFVNETSILRQLKDSKAKNINIIHDAFDWHSQLWIVSEYCPGGSVHTLMKGSPKKGLEEQYVVPIARELAVALKHIHEAGIIHRDVKAANILITQDGQLQLCDFGVSGVLKSNADKRSTIIGTPYWMAPEMLKEDALANGYGVEVDIWAYGIAMIEIATGLPPNANIVATKLHMFMDKPPRLEGDGYSAAQKEFVDYCLKTQPEERPSAENLLQHSYVFNTSKRFPTSSLKSLIDRFYRWEQMGGQRMSLYTPHGATAPNALDEEVSNEEGWIFSTTDDFSFLNHSVSTPEMRDHFFDDQDLTPKQDSKFPRRTAYDKAKEEQAAMRGERALGRVFDQNAAPYEFSSDDDHQSLSDLPLRNMSSDFVAHRNTLIDLDDVGDVNPNFDLGDVPTVRAKPNRFLLEDEDDEGVDDEPRLDQPNRLTRDWKFPIDSNKKRPLTLQWSFDNAQSEAARSDETSLPFRPTLKHTATEPIGNFFDHLHPINPSSGQATMVSRDEVIDLEYAEVSRPSTAHSSLDDSYSSDWSNSNPFDLETESYTPVNRGSYHRQSQSAPHARPISQRSFRRSASEQHRRGGSGDDLEDSLRILEPPAHEWEANVHNHRLQQLEAERNHQRPLLSAPPVAQFRPSGWDMSDDDRDLEIIRTQRPSNGRTRTLPFANGYISSDTEASESHRGLNGDHANRSEDNFISFPEPIAPDPSVLVDNPDRDMVIAEMDRLIGDYIIGLKGAGGLMGVSDGREVPKADALSGGET